MIHLEKADTIFNEFCKMGENIRVFYNHYITSYIQYHLKSIFDNNGIQTYILHVFDAVVFYFIMLAFVTEYPLPRMPAIVTHINKVMN